MILLFFGHFMYSQSYEYIKKLDTIYIPFRESEFNIKIDYPEEKNGFKNRSYIFNYKKKLIILFISSLTEIQIEF